MGHTAAAAVELRAVVHWFRRTASRPNCFPMITSAPNQEGQPGPVSPPAPEEPNPAAEAVPAAIDPNRSSAPWTARRDKRR